MCNDRTASARPCTEKPSGLNERLLQGWRHEPQTMIQTWRKKKTKRCSINHANIFDMHHEHKQEVKWHSVERINEAERSFIERPTKQCR